MIVPCKYLNTCLATTQCACNESTINLLKVLTTKHMFGIGSPKCHPFSLCFLPLSFNIYHISLLHHLILRPFSWSYLGVYLLFSKEFILVFWMNLWWNIRKITCIHLYLKVGWVFWCLQAYLKIQTKSYLASKSQTKISSLDYWIFEEDLRLLIKHISWRRIMEIFISVSYQIF